MRKKITLFLSFICIVVSIILMSLPISAVLVFAPSPTKRITETFSYFDGIVYGYGNVFPLLTGVISIVSFVIILWILIRNNYSSKSELNLKIISILSVFTSFLSVVLFNHISDFSIPGIIIFILILMATLLQFLYFRRRTK